MKNYFILVTIFLSDLLYSQTTISLEQAAAYQKIDTIGIPEWVQYVKDINHKIDPFAGNWKGTDKRGWSYELRLAKKENYHEENWDISWDLILGNIIIKDQNNNILLNELNAIDKNSSLFGKNFQHSTYVMYFVGNVACNDFGDVYLEIFKNNPNKMTLYYYPDSEMLNPAKCPNIKTYELLLPTDKIILNKQ
ncbi:hypothetical protein [Elizabethkingia meningoseptica]|uniref:hypothetical protein n=1 Tax=Elizabethkingia meningoseptica TaxID=238 RepID=UPI00389198B7